MLFVVSPLGPEKYLVRCSVKTDVPHFLPEFPADGLIMRRDNHFRELFIYIRTYFFSFFKIYLFVVLPLVVIAAERASYLAPVFASRISRTRTLVMEDLVKTHLLAGK